MFKCDKCGKNSKKNEPCNKVVVDKREVQYYTAIVKQQKTGKELIFYKPITEEQKQELINEEYELKEEKITNGWEIVQEESLCQACYQELQVV